MKQFSPGRILKTKATVSLIVLTAFFGAASRADIIYCANWNSDTIERYDSVTGADLGTFASSGGPRGVALSGSGNLYVAEWKTQQIVKYAPGGAGSVYASGLEGAEDITFDSSGNLYYGSLWNNTIVKITPDGATSVFASTGFNPYGLAFDRAGNLYAANCAGGAIMKYTPDGQSSVFATGLQGPIGLAFDGGGNLFVANYFGQSIEKFTPGGQGTTFASGLADPAGIAFDSAGNLFVADEWGGPSYGRLEKITPNGTVSVFADGNYSGPVYLAIQPVPEPAGAALLGAGLALLWARSREAGCATRKRLKG